MKKFLISFLTLTASFYTAGAVFAAEPMSEKGLERISWAVRCCGEPPLLFILSLIGIAVLAVISVLYYKHISGGGTNAK